MLKVNNKKAVRNLSDKSLKGNMPRNIIAVIAIALLAGIIFLLVRRGYQPSEEVRHLTDIPAGKK